MIHTEEEICTKLGLNAEEIVNIYPYGSRIYGSATPKSDYDYVIVYKSSRLPSGAFKQNAISSKDFTIQASIYSRGGFQDAINNYDMAALECIMLPENNVVKAKWPFKLRNFNLFSFKKEVISNASNSWHRAVQRYKDENMEMAKKGVYHSLRVLEFGLHFLKTKMIDYSLGNEHLLIIMRDDNFSPRHYISRRDELIEKIRKIESNDTRKLTK